MLTVLLMSCSADFDVSRHQLGPFRVAAMGVEGGVARAAVYSGLGMYHEARPTLEWTLDGEPLGEGYDVAVPAAEGELGLVATSPDGEERFARVSVAEAPAAFGVERYSVALGDLDLEARAAVEGEAADAALEGASVRLVLTGTDGTARWMVVGDGASVLELDEVSSDVVNEELTWDDGAIVGRESLDPGLFHLLVLTIDGEGGNQWLWTDAAIGAPGPYLHHAGRLLPVDEGTDPVALAATGYVAGTLRRTDDLAGLQLVDLESVVDLAEQDSLECARSDEPFELAWVAEGRCPRPDVEGARVVLEVW